MGSQLPVFSCNWQVTRSQSLPVQEMINRAILTVQSWGSSESELCLASRVVTDGAGEPTRCVEQGLQPATCLGGARQHRGMGPWHGQASGHCPRLPGSLCCLEYPQQPALPRRLLFCPSASRSVPFPAHSWIWHGNWCGCSERRASCKPESLEPQPARGSWAFLPLGSLWSSHATCLRPSRLQIKTPAVQREEVAFFQPPLIPLLLIQTLTYAETGPGFGPLDSLSRCTCHPLD